MNDEYDAFIIISLTGRPGAEFAPGKVVIRVVIRPVIPPLL